MEHWKTYEGYIERKERVIEVATMVYLAFATTLISREAGWWPQYWPKSCQILVLLAILGLLAVTALLVLCFVNAQMRLRTRGASISNASQTMMTRWLHHSPPPKDLEPETVPEFSGVQFPRALADEICRQPQGKLDAFELTVYGLIIAWTVALLGRVILASTR